jgi:predicted secreted protein with PEFG-CTERM motif
MVCIIDDAHAEFDKSGNYVCNPFNTGLETNIYTSTVNQINYKLDSYLNSHPNSTLQQQHDVIMQDQKTWDLYNKSKQCIDSLGVNPDRVAPLSYKVNQALAIPEFGLVAGMIIAISIASVVIISRKARLYF